MPEITEDRVLGVPNLFGDLVAPPTKQQQQYTYNQRLSVYTREQIIEAAFAYFRKTGFPYRNLPVHISMQQINALATSKNAALRQSIEAYHVADTYHHHRFHVTVGGKKSPLEAFNNDRVLRILFDLILQYDGEIQKDLTSQGLTLVRGTQACANFRPGFAAWIYRKFCKPGDTVLDTSTGYGGRLIGFIAAKVPKFYIGIDPNTLTHKGNVRMARELGFADRIKLYNLPVEDVDPKAVANRCNFAFTSPPYFTKEHYSEEGTQSWVRYKTDKAWRKGFLHPMMALQYAALKKGGYSAVNVADVNIAGEHYNLVDWTKRAGVAAGFKFISEDHYALTRGFGANLGKVRKIGEAVLVFRKC